MEIEAVRPKEIIESEIKDLINTYGIRMETPDKYYTSDVASAMRCVLTGGNGTAFIDDDERRKIWSALERVAAYLRNEAGAEGFSTDSGSKIYGRGEELSPALEFTLLGKPPSKAAGELSTLKSVPQEMTDCALRLQKKFETLMPHVR